MLSKSFWRRWCGHVGQLKGRRGRTNAGLRRSWSAEILEERTMLSTITVTTLTDSVTTDGQVSLREAINAANSNTSIDGSTAGDSGVQDLIVFQQGLTGTILLNSSLGQLGISETVRINGLGSSSTIIDAQGNSRVFYIDTSAGDVALDNLTVTNGATLLSSDKGGGISFHSSGTLSMTGSVVTNNSTAGFDAQGAGIFSDGGNVSLTNSTVSQNSALGLDTEGAGIAVIASGNITLTDSIVSGNSTTAGDSEGAGIYADGGNVTLLRSTVTGNSSLAASSSGAGIHVNFGNVTLTDSTISNNSTLDVFGNGAGIYAVGGGSVTATGSTISGNSSTGAFSRGGGIFNYNGDITLTNSTVANNSTIGADSDGGGLYTYYGDIEIVSSTISGNTAIGLGADGGGVYSYDGGMTITNSIIAGNSAHILSSGQDIFFYNYSGSMSFTATHSLIGKAGGTPLTPANPDGNGNIVGNSSGIDPQLRALADNGGPTETMALILGSPAINAGGTTALTTDQRGTGFLRVVNGGLDMGAYEYQLYNNTTTTTYDVVEGGTFANIVIMTFTSPDPAAVQGDFNVTVDWQTTVLNPTYLIQFVSGTSGSSTWNVVASATFPVGASASSPYAVEVTVDDNHGYSVTTDDTTFSVFPAANPPRHIDRQTGLAGFYYVNGLFAKVLQNGSVLTLVDETGTASTGTITNGTDITAPDFGLTAEFDQDAGTITFSDSTVWTKIRQIEGKWLTGSGKVAGIRQLGTELTFVGGTGSSCAGSFTSATALSTSQWGGVTGTLSADGTQINWSNSTVWYLIPDFQGDWESSTGAPTRIEQTGTTLQFVNRAGQISTGSMISATQVMTGVNWGSLLGTIVGDSIQFSNGTTWSIPSTTTGYPDVGGLWQRSTNNQDVRVLQADLVLTFVNASGGVSAGQFVSTTQVFATDWNQHGTIVGDEIQWTNGTIWNQLPYVSGSYINQNNAETGITQLEHQLTFTDQFGTVTHGTLVDATNIVETDGGHRTATISNGVITWSNSPIWTNLPGLSGNWQENATTLPTYVEQSGLKLLFVDQTGVIFTGGFLTPTTAQVTEQIIPAPPPLNVTIPDAETIDFGAGLEWTKFPATVLDDVFADPNFWPFL